MTESNPDQVYYFINEVGFGDGGLPACGGDVYAQWRMECSHSYDCQGEGDYDEVNADFEY